MHPKNYGTYITADPEAVEPVEHEPGERFTVPCPTCEEETMGEIEGGYSGVCWRCDDCGGAIDLTVTG